MVWAHLTAPHVHLRPNCASATCGHCRGRVASRSCAGDALLQTCKQPVPSTIHQVHSETAACSSSVTDKVHVRFKFGFDVRHFVSRDPTRVERQTERLKRSTASSLPKSNLATTLLEPMRKCLRNAQRLSCSRSRRHETLWLILQTTAATNTLQNTQMKATKPISPTTTPPIAQCLF